MIDLDRIGFVSLAQSQSVEFECRAWEDSTSTFHLSCCCAGGDSKLGAQNLTKPNQLSK